MLDDQILKAAEDLYNAEMTRNPIEPVTSSYPEMTIDDAYRIQMAGVELRKRRMEERIVGKKIGLTSIPMQEQLGVKEPDYGHILDKMMIGEGESARFEELIQPRVEGEVAFVLDRDIKGPGVTIIDILKSLKFVAPALEIIDSRIRDWKIRIQDTIADNASSARIVIGGKPTRVEDVDLRYVGMVFEKNSSIIATGAGAAVMRNPAQAVAWLANRVAAFGVPLLAGEVIMSGSLTASVPIIQGDTVTATFDRLGSVRVGFS